MSEAILLTYDVHPDVDRDEYEKWLREVDNPFWNAQPGVKEYVNWKVTEEKLGQIGFPYFDLAILEEGATFDSVVGSAAVIEFAANWVKLWGQVPDGEAAENFKGGSITPVASPSITNKA